MATHVCATCPGILKRAFSFFFILLLHLPALLLSIFFVVVVGSSSLGCNEFCNPTTSCFHSTSCLFLFIFFYWPSIYLRTKFSQKIWSGCATSGGACRYNSNFPHIPLSSFDGEKLPRRTRNGWERCCAWRAFETGGESACLCRTRHRLSLLHNFYHFFFPFVLHANTIY